MRNPDLRFCPRCGGGLEWRPAGDTAEPAEHPTCSACGFILWQNPKPSVEALIARRSEGTTDILLGRLTSGEGWDLPGNFLNAADRIEEALVRECRREMGVEVIVDHILGVFEGEFAGAPILSIVYVCTIAAGKPRPSGPIDEVRWFPLRDPPNIAYPAVASAIEAMQRREGGR